MKHDLDPIILVLDRNPYLRASLCLPCRELLQINMWYMTILLSKRLKLCSLRKDAYHTAVEKVQIDNPLVRKKLETHPLLDCVWISGVPSANNLLLCHQHKVFVIAVSFVLVQDES